MTYTENGDHVTLDMTRDDYDNLLLIIGYATGAAQGDRARFYGWLDFVNRMNRTNPGFIPYEIPAEFQHLTGIGCPK